MKMVLVLSLISSLWGKAFSFSPDLEVLPAGDFEHHCLTRKVYSLMVDTRPDPDAGAPALKGAVHVPFGADFLKRLDDALDARNAPKSVLIFLYTEDAAATEALLEWLKVQLAEKPKTSHKVQMVYVRAGGLEAQ